MTHRVHVGMSIREARDRATLQRSADAAGASVAFLQHGEPSLTAELDRLDAAGVRHVTLVGVALGTGAPARSWLRRVAGHWVRSGTHRPVVEIEGRAVTGDEAPLSSPAWERVPDFDHHVLVCRGPRCSAHGADDTARALDVALSDAGLGDDDVLVTQTGCLFPCNHAPVVVVHPANTWLGRVDGSVARRLVEECIGRGMALGDHEIGGASSSTQSPHTPAPGIR